MLQVQPFHKVLHLTLQPILIAPLQMIAPRPTLPPTRQTIKPATKDKAATIPRGVGDANDPDDPNEPTIPDVPDNSPTIYLEAEKKDDKVIVKVCARNNPGVASFNFRVDYDKTAMEPEKIEKGLVSVTSNLQQTTNLAGYITAVWVDVNGTTENGTLFTITFKPKSGATKATFSITADKNAFINPDVKPVEFKLKGTEIKF